MSATADELEGSADEFRFRTDRKSPTLRDLFERGLLAFAMVDVQLARTVPEDLLALRGLGYQFIGIWVLLFAVQGIAFTTLSGDPSFGQAYAALSATLITLADRHFIANDFMADGEYWYRFDRNPNDPLLPRLLRKRWLGMLVRYGFGIIISIAVVTIATPGLFRYEIAAEVHRLRNERNQGAEAEIKAHRDGKKQIWDSKLAELTQLDAQILKTQQTLTELQTGTPAAADADAEIEQLSSEERRLRQQADHADRCAKAEEHGLDNPDCSSHIAASKLRGCFDNCLYWKSEAASFRGSADRLQADRERLVSEANGRRAQQGTQRTAEIDALQTDLQNLRATRDRAVEDEAAARTAWEESDQTYGTTRRNDADYIDTPVAGIKIVYDAMERVLADASGTTLRMLLYLKIFLIFLESIVFSSRLFGTARSYSKATYIRYRRRWAAYDAT